MTPNTPEALAKMVRLDRETIRELARLFGEYLKDDPGASVLLFGSRADLESKGGDLDLIIVSGYAAAHAYELRKRLRMAIKERLGEQRVDILIISDDTDEEPSSFVQLALMEGVQIWP